MDHSQARALLRTRDDLRHDGWTDRRIAQALTEGALVRVDHAVYVDGRAWADCYAEGRQLLRVMAAWSRMRDGEAVASHTSAAVLLGLPLYRIEPRRAHVIDPRSNGRVRAGEPTVARHRVDLRPDEVVAVGGIRCTTLARTVADVIRLPGEEAALAVADAALARVAWRAAEHAYDEDAAELLRGKVAAALPLGGRGVRQARFVLGIADGRAQLPGESVSRLQLLRLGFAPPRLQVPIPAPGGGRYYVDFGIDDAHAWGEFDGRGKYLDPELRGAGVDAEDAVLAEKMREDWIRGTTGRRMPRWGYEHISSPVALGRRLARFHVSAP